MNKLRYLPSGDSSLIIEVGNEISENINKKIRDLVYCINKAKIKGIVELIPTYSTILISYDPIKISFNGLVEKLKEVEKNMKEIKLPEALVIHIPTLYGGEYGKDIQYVSKHNNITAKEVIKIHSEAKYLVYMLGFTPGFPYLGGMSEKISTPRLKTPREKIPAGSVGIAGSQTGIYPIDSPGGWRLIGRTPIKLFNLDREKEVLLKAGDYLKFYPIDEEEYKEIEKKVKSNEYQIKKTVLEGDN
ncbi:MAG: 5-oxoprolinase subunit PxpB [Firmicutes bacterium]|nr:5-oxoprolinase subunit PxpB [Bacillota bacterium]